MNVEQRQAAADPQTKPHDLGCESACFQQLASTTTIAIYYYYSARKLILIYHPTEGRRLSWPNSVDSPQTDLVSALHRRPHSTGSYAWSPCSSLCRWHAGVWLLPYRWCSTTTRRHLHLCWRYVHLDEEQPKKTLKAFIQLQILTVRHLLLSLILSFTIILATTILSRLTPEHIRVLHSSMTLDKWSFIWILTCTAFFHAITNIHTAEKMQFIIAQWWSVAATTTTTMLSASVYQHIYHSTLYWVGVPHLLC